MTDTANKINAALSSSPSDHALDVASERLAAACDTPYPGCEPTIPPIPAAHNGIEGELLSEYEQSVPTLQSILPECIRKYIRPRSEIGEHDKKIEMDESDGFPGGISVYAVRETQEDLIGDEATGTKSLHTTGEWYMTEEQFIDAVKMMMSLVYVPELDAEPMPPDDSYDED